MVPAGAVLRYFAAKDKGYFKDQGLDVTILPGGVDIVPATVVAGGNAEFGISWVPKLLASRESGADVQIIGMPFQRSGTLQIAMKDKNITKPEDWKGKKVGTWGFGNEAELYAAMRKVGIDPTKPYDVTIVPQDFTMTAFLNGDIDAAQAMIYNEYAQVLEAKNPATGELYTPEDMDVVSMESAGTAMLQDAIFADESWLKESGNEDTATKFLTGRLQGLAVLPRQPRRGRRDRPGRRRQAAQGSPDLAAQRDQRPHLAVPERDRHDGQDRVRPDRADRARWRDHQGAPGCDGVPQRPHREGPRGPRRGQERDVVDARRRSSSPRAATRSRPIADRSALAATTGRPARVGPSDSARGIDAAATPRARFGTMST